MWTLFLFSIHTTGYEKDDWRLLQILFNACLNTTIIPIRVWYIRSELIFNIEILMYFGVYVKYLGFS